jgi:hypothetical protein
MNGATTNELRRGRRKFSRRIKGAEPLNSKSRGGTGEGQRTLGVCRMLEQDRDPIVTKALSRALPELAKRDPRAVWEYIAKRKDVLPALVLREVKNKLRTGLKNPKTR